MKVDHKKSNQRPDHIFELIKKIYPELHRKMFEAIDRNDNAFKKTMDDISKLKKGKW